MTRIKICGVSTAESIDAAIAAGADWLGFNFFPPSPRYVAPARAAGLIAGVSAGTAKVAVLVDADDALIDAAIAAGCDIVQLHGSETPDRIAAAIAGAGPADRLLLDAKAPKGATLPGGNGLAFDWRLLDGMRLPQALQRPWGLSGGLDAGNVGAALALLAPDFVDVSSGVEDQPGVKSSAKIQAFAAAVRAA
jgi:phosphoribosylanthranilate isomerase